MITKKTAFVFGSSGLVGKNLIKLLLENPNYEKVIFFTRKPLVIVHAKAQEFAMEKYMEFDFSETDPENVHVFCCIGTTIRKAGTKEEFYKTDHDIPVQIATWAREKKINTFIVISSIGAMAGSGNFYLKTKGEMEESLKSLQFPKLYIVRPSLILGTRDEFRLGEELGKMVGGFLSYFMFGGLKKYRAIEAKKVARAMIVLANSDKKEVVFESDQLELLAGKG